MEKLANPSIELNTFIAGSFLSINAAALKGSSSPLHVWTFFYGGLNQSRFYPGFKIHNNKQSLGSSSSETGLSLARSGRKSSKLILVQRICAAPYSTSTSYIFSLLPPRPKNGKQYHKVNLSPTASAFWRAGAFQFCLASTVLFVNSIPIY